MARIRRAKEKRQQPYWATLIKGTAPGSFIPRLPADLANGVRLFENKPNGGISVTNMEGAGGSFPTRQVYRILSFRVWLMFFGCLDAGAANIDVDLYHQAVSQLYWELQVSNKQAFQAPTMYLPAGGGLYGDNGAAVDQAIVTNGMPTHKAICSLARSIALSAGQDFYVRATVEANGLSNFGTTLGTLTDGQLVVTFFLDGIHVRDIL
jgi:hypothetical protein